MIDSSSSVRVIEQKPRAMIAHGGIEELAGKRQIAYVPLRRRNFRLCAAKSSPTRFIASRLLSQITTSLSRKSNNSELVLAKNFEGKIEELHEGNSDRSIDRDFQPAARFLTTLDDVSNIRSGLVKGVGKLLKVLSGGL